MTEMEIMWTQERVGTTVDGFWGPLSTQAAKDHLLSMMPDPHPFPSRHAVNEFYGPHGEKGGYTPPMEGVTSPFPMYLWGDESKEIQGDIWCHELCADAFESALELVAEAFPSQGERERAGITSFFGIYNPRKMRGSLRSWSMHAWACAGDWDALNNGNKSHWPVDSEMPITVMECFAKAGITPAGAFWSRDAMHFEAIKPY